MVRTEWPRWATGERHGTYWMTTMSHRWTSWYVLNDHAKPPVNLMVRTEWPRWTTGVPHVTYWMTTCEPPVNLMVRTEWPRVSHRCTSWYVLNDHAEPPVYLMVRTEWPRVSHRCTSWYVLNDHVWATDAPHDTYWMTTCEPPMYLTVAKLLDTQSLLDFSEQVMSSS
jgi:hypothetical protein